MNIKQQRDNDKLTVFIDGKIDTSTAPGLWEELQKLIPGVKELTLDFEKVEYISSAGLRILLMTNKAMSEQGEMIIKNVNDDIMEVFELTCFVDVLKIV